MSVYLYFIFALCSPGSLYLWGLVFAHVVRQPHGLELVLILVVVNCQVCDFGGQYRLILKYVLQFKHNTM